MAEIWRCATAATCVNPHLTPLAWPFWRATRAHRYRVRTVRSKYARHRREPEDCSRFLLSGGGRESGTLGSSSPQLLHSYPSLPALRRRRTGVDGRALTSVPEPHLQFPFHLCGGTAPAEHGCEARVPAGGVAAFARDHVGLLAHALALGRHQPVVTEPASGQVAHERTCIRLGLRIARRAVASLLISAVAKHGVTQA